MRIFWMLTWLLVSAPAWSAARFSLSIGCDVGSGRDGALRWAEADARRMHELLHELGSVASGRGILLQGPDKVTLQAAFARLQGQVEEAKRQGFRTEVFVYFSGHGDADSLHLVNYDLLLSDFQNMLRAVPADTSVAILDACRSNPVRFGRSKGATHVPAFDISLAREPGPVGRVIITSAGANEIAQESDEIKGSFFTHHLLSGLRGAADGNSDGRVSLAEIYRYAYNRTLAASHGETAAVQHPEMVVNLEGEGELVLTTLQRARSSLILGKDLAGNILVVDDRNGQVLAEVVKPKHNRLRLALPAGRFRIQLRENGRIYAGEVALAWGGKQEINHAMLDEQNLKVALRKGSELDPNSLAIISAAVTGSPSALGSGLLVGGVFGLEHHVANLPLFLLGTVQVSRAHAQNEIRNLDLQHLETRLAVGVGYDFYLGPIRLAASLAAGLIMIHEKRRYRETQAQETGYSIGPCVIPAVGVRLPIQLGFSIATQLEVPMAYLRVDDRNQTALGWSIQAGIEYAF